MAPYWFMNAHNIIIYITRGNCRMQILNQKGQAVFDGEVQEGKVIEVPRNFAVLKQTGEQGCEWVAFNTKDGGAKLDKYSRRETPLFSRSSWRYGRGRVASA